MTRTERRRTATYWLAAIAVLALSTASLARSEACTEAESCGASLALRSGARVPYFRSLPLQSNAAVVRAVIVVHGNRRDGDRYFESLVRAAAADDRLKDTILLAPQFRTAADGVAAGEVRWSSGGWKVGDKSRDATRTSSFQVMDELLEQICAGSREVFPSLSTVAIVGHSAGGQYVHRYAAGGKGCGDSTVELRYVVMNPSSYLYLDARRSSGSGEFAIPRTHCWDYDDYKYGLRDLNDYMSRRGEATIRKNLLERQTYYVAGAEDTRRSKSLDQSCEGDLQGPQRLARFENYRRYTQLFPNWLGANFQTVSGIGHDGAKMLSSEAVRRILFR